MRGEKSTHKCWEYCSSFQKINNKKNIGNFKNFKSLKTFKNEKLESGPEGPTDAVRGVIKHKMSQNIYGLPQKSGFDNSKQLLFSLLWS